MRILSFREVEENYKSLSPKARTLRGQGDGLGTENLKERKREK